MPQFFTIDLPATLAYDNEKLGFDCVGTWQDPPVYAIVTRDEHRIHFRCAEPPTANPEKGDDERDLDMRSHSHALHDGSVPREPRETAPNVSYRPASR